MNPAVAVIGAGNVACALAADLVLGGFDVRLFTRSAERRRAIREAGGITLTGAREGHAPVKVVDEFAGAVAGAGVVSLAVPTYALAEYAPALVAETTDDQLIWLNPGHTHGSGGHSGLSRRRSRSSGPR